MHRLWRDAITSQHGGDRKSEEAKIKTDNVSLDLKHGNSRSYTLSRLKRQAPELFERVVDGELSANAAAIKGALAVRKTFSGHARIER